MPKSEKRASLADVENVHEIMELAIVFFNQDRRCLALELKEEAWGSLNLKKQDSRSLERYYTNAIAFVMEAVGVLQEDKFRGLSLGKFVPLKVLDDINLLDKKHYSRISSDTLANITTDELAQHLTQYAIVLATQRSKNLSNFSKRRKLFLKLDQS